MNIKEAKEQIKNAMTAYFTKDKHGKYVIPIEKQRPVFLMGPPGIGKTAIIEQIAQELNVAMVSYSMTHHTRQSALGLPFIVKKKYAGVEFDISEYTMSEIIASVYETIEISGKSEGILFLDEINCVSETLAPAMLQFLQYKTFGRHKIPTGWIVITAGNPPEYNNSVRDFDIVTWDRLKRIDVEPDFDAWKEYAYKSNIHASILTYLEIKQSEFYRIETNVDGKSFVTARGWSDLSDMIKLYEQHGLAVDENLISQYIQNRKIAKEFSVYYDLYNKYKADYQVDKILEGKSSDELMQRARNAAFDERLTLIGLLLDKVLDLIKDVYNEEIVYAQVAEIIDSIRTQNSTQESGISKIIEKKIYELEKYIEQEKKANSLSREDEEIVCSAIEIVRNDEKLLDVTKGLDYCIKELKSNQNSRIKNHKTHVTAAKTALSNLFVFCEEAFGEGQELLILVTELTVSMFGTYFISRYGCEEYFKHNKELLFYEKQKEIIGQLETMDLEEN